MVYSTTGPEVSNGQLSILLPTNSQRVKQNEFFPIWQKNKSHFLNFRTKLKHKFTFFSKPGWLSSCYFIPKLKIAYRSIPNHTSLMREMTLISQVIVATSGHSAESLDRISGPLDSLWSHWQWCYQGAFPNHRLQHWMYVFQGLNLIVILRRIINQYVKIFLHIVTSTSCCLLLTAEIKSNESALFQCVFCF